jgi:hypothetical protein
MCPNLQKFCSLVSICFEGPNRAKYLSFQMIFLPSFWLKQLSIFEMSYLLESWELDCAYNPYYSTRFVDHLETLLIQV